MVTAVIDGDGNLVITGEPTAANNIAVSPSSGGLHVSANGADLGNFTPTGRVIVIGGTAKDIVGSNFGAYAVEARLGGANDKFSNGNGDGPSTVVVSGGDPNVSASHGHNFFVSGPGKASMNCGDGSSVLAAGSFPGLSYDDLRAAAEAFAADAAGYDLSALEAAFVVHTSTGRSVLTGNTVTPVLYFCRADDVLANFNAAKGDRKFVV